MTPRDLYVDLLIRTISNTIYEDPAMDPWHNQTFNLADRETGRDWPRVAHSMAGQARLRNTADLVQATLDQNIPGHYIETGVWRGGSTILMRGVLAANGVKDRKIYVADSFEGLPPPDVEAFAADAGDIHYTLTDLPVSLEQVRSNFGKYGLLDDQVVFVKGFSKTLFRDWRLLPLPSCAWMAICTSPPSRPWRRSIPASLREDT